MSKKLTSTLEIEMAYDEFVAEHVELALRILKKYVDIKIQKAAARFSGAGNRWLDDAESVAFEAAWTALKNFDASKGGSFKPYFDTIVNNAIHRTIGNMNRLKKVNPNVSKEIKQIKECKQTFFELSGKYPSEEQLAEILDIPVARIKDLLLRDSEVASLQAIEESKDDEGRGRTFSVSVEYKTPENIFEDEELWAEIEKSDILNDTEKQSVVLAFREGYKQKEIADQLALTPAAINMALKSAKKKLVIVLADWN